MPNNIPQPRIPVTLLTGFLGSGKTTVLNYLVQQPELQQTLVLINEFGEIGLDHLLVTQGRDDVVAVSYTHLTLPTSDLV